METPSKYPRKPQQHERHHLPIEQIKQLLEEAQEPALKTFRTMAITTGMRRGELLGLCWQDIDGQNETVHILGYLKWLAFLRSPLVIYHNGCSSAIIYRYISTHRKGQ